MKVSGIFFIIFFSLLVFFNPLCAQAKAELPSGLVQEQNNNDLNTLIRTNSCPGCNLSGLNLNRMNLQEANLEGADLSRAKMYLTDLSNANLANTNLREAGFGGADLGGADLRGADLRGTSFSGAYLAGAKFDGEFIVTRPYKNVGLPGVENVIYAEDTSRPKMSPGKNEVTISPRRDFEKPVLVQPINTTPDNDKNKIVNVSAPSVEINKNESVPLQAKGVPRMKPVILAGTESVEQQVQENEGNVNNNSQLVLAADPGTKSLPEASVFIEQDVVYKKKSIIPVKIAAPAQVETGKKESANIMIVSLVSEQSESGKFVEKKNDPLLVKLSVAKPVVDSAEKSQQSTLVQNDQVAVPPVPAALTSENVVIPELQIDPDIEKSLTRLIESNKCYGCKLTGVNLSGRNLSGADLESADLTGANLEGVDLEEANLKGAILIHSNLKNVNFEKADLYNVDFSGSDMTGANLQGALIDDAQFSGAVGVVLPKK